MTEVKIEKFNVQMVVAKTYDGSIESYNEMVDDIGGDSLHPVIFLDEKGNSTWKFTGTVAFTKTGMIYRPGDTYLVEKYE